MRSPASQTGSGHVDVAVRLTPRADKDAIAGFATMADGAEVLLARVRALPEAGEANAALIKVVAAHFGVPRSAVSLLAGGKQRIKRLRIAGKAADLQARLEALRPGGRK